MGIARAEHLRLVAAGLSDGELAEILSALSEECYRRMHVDAANYITRAVACLDAARLNVKPLPATTEPSATF